MRRIGIISLFISLFVLSCEPGGVSNGEFDVPPGFTTPVYHPVDNGMNQQGYYLGRKLFFDPILSRNGTISCGSCHHPTEAFSDQGNVLSVGIDAQTGHRNSPPLFNLAWQPAFMWDGGINHIEVMPLAPITNHVEMDESLSNVVDKLNMSSEYISLFELVFETKPINSQQLLKALAWYMTSIVSANSKYDQYMRGETTFNSSELNGLNIFNNTCASCHTPPLFTDYSYRNNGLYNIFQDSGRYRITQIADDIGKFKVPSLRNVEVTYPYMHDGSIASLEEVIEHYNSSIIASSSLDPLLVDNQFIELDEFEKLDLLAFLKTLTDQDFLNNSYYTKN
jgi:cytochrome c peroxidase